MGTTKFIIKDGLSGGIKKFISNYPKIREEALIKGGQALINWMANGSPKSSVVPPVLTGLLRGSGSVFVGSKFITASPDESGKGTPNMSHTSNPNVITIGYNTDYARRLHEETWTPGPRSVQSGNVGNKWIRKHLEADKDLLFAFIAKIYRSHY